MLSLLKVITENTCVSVRVLLCQPGPITYSSINATPKDPPYLYCMEECVVYSAKDKHVSIRRRKVGLSTVRCPIKCEVRFKARVRVSMYNLSQPDIYYHPTFNPQMRPHGWCVESREVKKELFKKCVELRCQTFSNGKIDFWEWQEKGIPMNVLVKTGGLVFFTSTGAYAEEANLIFRPIQRETSRYVRMGRAYDSIKEIQLGENYFTKISTGKRMGLESILAIGSLLSHTYFVLSWDGTGVPQ